MGESSATLVPAAAEVRMRHRMKLRVFGLVGMAVVCLAFPGVGPDRYWLFGLLLAATSVLAAIPRLVPRRFWMLAQTSFDVALAVVLIGIIPDVWTSGLVIVMTSSTSGASLLGRRAYLTLASLGLAGLGLVAYANDVQDWKVPLAVAAIMAPLVASYIGLFFHEEFNAAARLKDVADSSSALFWEVDAATGEFSSVSGRVEDVLGYRPDELPGCLPDLIVEEDRGRWWESVLDSDDDDFVLECRCEHSDGHVVWLRISVRRIVLGSRHILRGVALDITELVAVHEEVRRRAELDHLTQLPNRFVLVRELGLLLETGRNFSLFVLDLDRFKDINDTLGHQAGDGYLVEMARRLEDAMGDNGFVARVGGDEFAVVAEMEAGLDRVIELADQMMAVCEVPVELAGIDFAGSASCGIAIAPMHGSTVEDLLRRADLAMYAAKRTGSRRHLFEFAADEAKVSRLKLTSEAEPALGSGQMQLWFQPKVDLGTGELLGAEGLLRWHHPERGVLLPSRFLDILELTRHRRQLSRQVIHQGVAFLSQARERGVPISVAVNASIRDLLDDGLCEHLVHELTTFDVPPDLLTLEITERELMDDRTGFTEAANAVRAAGVQLSIDDFGTGHSSLLRLHQLPVNELKIDRSFVMGLGSDPQAEIIVGSIIELGASLGHRIVAEGIERDSEVRVLRELGCHIGQGYLYSPALPVEDFFSALCADRPWIIEPVI